MGTTSKGYPYPEGADLVMDGDDAIKALAEAIDEKLPYAVAAGRVTLTNVAANATKSTTVALPAGRFRGDPMVTVSAVTGSPNARPVSAGGSSPTSIQIYATNVSSATAPSIVVNWNAVDPDTDVALLAAPLPAAATTESYTVTCPTEGCANQGIPIIISPWPDPETGEMVPIEQVNCGVCGADITDTLTPIETS